MSGSSPNRRGLLAVLLVAPFMAQADATIANVATPAIHSGLGASGAALELVIGGYLIAFAVLLITDARLGQTHGYRRVFVVGISGFGLASLACGLAPDPGVLVAARVVQGAGAALMFPQALTGIQLNFEGEARVRAIGWYALAPGRRGRGTDPRRRPRLSRPRRLGMAGDLPDQRPDRRPHGPGRVAIAAGRRAAEVAKHRRHRRRRPLPGDASRRGTTRPRARGGLAGVELALPRRERPRFRGLLRPRAARRGRRLGDPW